MTGAMSRRVRESWAAYPIHAGPRLWTLDSL